jgi:DNA-binding transcriptional MerR regulator
MEKSLPSIPAKRYFTIGEVGDLCGVKPHVLRYWEQEFTQLRPMKRRGNRRYYQHHEVLMIRRIRELLYDQGFTISGARNKLQELAHDERERRRSIPRTPQRSIAEEMIPDVVYPPAQAINGSSIGVQDGGRAFLLLDMRRELQEIRELLSTPA